MSQDRKEFEALKRIAERMGYRFDVTEDGREERMIRPDGTVAIIARKRQTEKEPNG